MEENRQDKIREKGFNMSGKRPFYEGPLDFNSIKVGTKTLDDAVLNLGTLSKVHKQFGNKLFILKAIKERNLPLMREISNYFYNTNGIYSRVCDYFAFLYRYDWYVVPEISDDKVKEEKVLTEFNNILSYLDGSYIKKMCGDIALNVIKNGVYYACLIDSPNGIVLQELPPNYCRSRFNSVGNAPALIEFDMRFFDDKFRDVNYRMKILKMFPKDFQKGYMLYKQGKLDVDDIHDNLSWLTQNPEADLNTNYKSGYWYPLEIGSAVKFSLANGEQPIFINSIPALIDLDAAQDIDRRKQMQQLQNIIIQQLPLDKNGDLIFDVDEARDIHNNAVAMLNHSIGTDVLTTFADVSVEDIGGDNASSSSSTDTLERMERAVYNMFGTSRNLFNTDSNLSLEKSILDDESTMRSLLLQFSAFFDKIVQKLGKNRKKYNFRFYMLETTEYNYKDMSKLYKEQVQLGYSKMLPQIALGHSQSSIIHNAYFENEVLKLSDIMIPPMMSSTMNAESLQSIRGKGTTSTVSSSSNNSSSGVAKAVSTEEKSAGRPEKAEDEKSQKTIQNLESM